MTSSIQSRLGTAPEEGCKAPVKTVANSPITLSGEQTVNTVAVVAGDRVLVNGQVDSSENGIYTVSTTAWTYAKDWNKTNDVIAGMLIPVSELTQLYQLDTFSGTYIAGTTEVTFTVMPATATTGITHTRGVTDYTLSDFLNITIPAEIVLNRLTLSAATADTTMKVGYAVNLAERTTGNGGGGMWDVVLASTVTPNTYNIVQCTGVDTLALVLREAIPVLTMTESEAVADLNVYVSKRVRLSDRGNAIFEVKTGETPDTYGIIAMAASGYQLVYAPDDNIYRTSAYGVKASTVGGTDYTAAFQASITALPDGATWVNDVTTTVAGTTEITISSKTNCKFKGMGAIQLKSGNTVSNSKGMLNADLCVDCDFSLIFDGNNQNASNDTNGTTGLIGCIYLTNCTRCDVKGSSFKNCNNVAAYLNTGCISCHIYDCSSVDSFGTDFKIGNGARDCTIHDNTCVVTRNIHVEDYSGTGTTGKQDGFIGIRFDCPNPKVYNNFCDNTDGTGVDKGICAFAGWFKGMSGSFDCYGNTWIGGTSSIQCYLETGIQLESMTIKDTCIGSGAGTGGIIVGTSGALVANVDHLVIDCIMTVSNTGVSIEANSGNFTAGSIEVCINGVTAGLSAVATSVANTHITGSVHHTGTSHAINLNVANECSVIGMQITTGAQVARSINLQDSSNCRIEGNRIKGNNNVSIRELGTSDYNIITGNITNTLITTLGANTVKNSNLESVV